MRLVIVESPYAGDVERNVEYARRCMADCIARGEAPFASHLLYTQDGVLNDGDPEQRNIGILIGFSWATHADATVVYDDYGISSGMKRGIENASKNKRPIEFRSIGGI